MILPSSHFFNKVGQKSQKPIPATHAAAVPDGFCIADPPGWERGKKKEKRGKEEEMIFNRRSPLGGQAQQPRGREPAPHLDAGVGMREALGCEGAFGTFGTFQKYKRIENRSLLHS